MSGYFEDNKGNKSSVRLSMFLTLLFTFIVIGFMVYEDRVDYALSLMLLLGAFAPKQIQNLSELKK